MMRRFLLLFLGVAVLFFVPRVAAFSGNIEPPKEQDTAPYAASDFYYIGKDGRRILLKVVPHTIVVWLESNVGAGEERTKFFQSMGWGGSTAAVEEITAPPGMYELKRSLGARSGVFRITFSEPQDIVSLLNKVRGHDAVADAWPVFERNGDLIFPTGVWMQTKHLMSYEQEALDRKAVRHGYTQYWHFYHKRPSGIDPLLNYYYRNIKISDTNVLRVSRLLAEDIYVLWAVPDFTSVKPLLRVKAEISRPSGTLGAEFTLSYHITYDARKVRIDSEVLRKIGFGDIKPQALVLGLVQSDPVYVEEKAGFVLVRLRFRTYQAGEFLLLGLPIPYTFAGASPEILPEKMLASTVSFRVVGLVPRDATGKPLLTDIFGYKRMHLITPSLPSAPVPPVFPKTDLRFWTQSFLLQYPAAGGWMRRGGSIVVALGAAFLLSMVVRRLVSGMKRRRESAYALFMTLTHEAMRNVGEASPVPWLRAARKAVWEACALPDGKTFEEAIAECPEAVRVDIVAFLEHMRLLAARESVAKGDVDSVVRQVRAVRNRLRWLRIRSSLRGRR